MSKKILKLNDAKGVLTGYMFWCPGCKFTHSYDLIRWTFNNDMENPTFHPSLKYEGYLSEHYPRDLCHMYLTDGKINYLNDCTHDLVGQTVDMVEYPYNN